MSEWTRPKSLRITDIHGWVLERSVVSTRDKGVWPGWMPIPRHWIYEGDVQDAFEENEMPMPSPLVRIIGAYLGCVDGTIWTVRVHMRYSQWDMGNVHICSRLHKGKVIPENEAEAEDRALQNICRLGNMRRDDHPCYWECKHQIRSQTFTVPKERSFN